MLKQIQRKRMLILLGIIIKHAFFFFQWEEIDNLIAKECIHRPNYIFFANRISAESISSLQSDSCNIILFTPGLNSILPFSFI